MRRLLLIACLAATATLPFSRAAVAQRAQYEQVIATLAKIYLVPEELIHRIIIRESKYQASLLGSGGAIGLMQIKLATARGLGYTGTAEGLRDPNTNLTYGVKYLAGAYRAAHGDHDRAVHYYAAGYYLAAKEQRLEHLKEAKSGASGVPPKELSKDQIVAAKDTAKDAAKDAAKDSTKDAATAKADAPAATDAKAADAKAADAKATDAKAAEASTAPAPAPQAGDTGMKAR